MTTLTPVASFPKALRQEGICVLEACSGREALKLTQIAVPHFVVTDIEMPDVDGLELCRLLRQLPATTRVPIVVVSGAAYAGRRRDRRRLRCRPAQALSSRFAAVNDSPSARQTVKLDGDAVTSEARFR